MNLQEQLNEAIKTRDVWLAEIEHLTAQIEAEQLPWTPKEGEDVFIVLSDGDATLERFYANSPNYRKLLAMGNIKQTREEAEHARDKQLALVRVNNRIAELNGGWKAILGENRYYIDNIYKGKFDILNSKNYQTACIFSYAKSEATLEQVIQEMRSDIILAAGWEV